MAKKYIVRDGFVLNLTVITPKGETVTRSYNSGDEVTLDEADAALHQHKLEFATQKDRDAALAAEQQARVTAQAANSPAELVTTLVAALQAAMAANASAPAAPQA